MSNFKRPAIISLAAIIGAQLSAIASTPQPGQTSGDCLQWASEGINQAIRREAFRKPADPLDGRNYWENDVWTDRQPQAAATAPRVTAQPPARIAPVAVSPRVVPQQPLSIAPMAPSADAGEYQRRRDAARAAGIVVPMQGENVRL